MTVWERDDVTNKTVQSLFHFFFFERATISSHRTYCRRIGAKVGKASNEMARYLSTEGGSFSVARKK